MNLLEIKKNIEYIIYKMKISILSSITYLPDFVIDIISEIMNGVYYLIFIEALFLNFDDFFGYTKYEMMFIWAIAYINARLIDSLLNNLESIPYEIVEGTLDKILMKPINPLLYITFRDFSITNIISLIIPIGVLINIWPFLSLNITIESIGLLIFSQILMTLFLLSSMLFVFSLTFWIGNTRVFYWIYLSITEVSHLPIQSFTRIVTRIFVNLYPIVLLGSIPAGILMNRIEINTIYGLTITTIIWVLISYITWNLGLKSYTSANSTGGIN